MPKYTDEQVERAKNVDVRTFLEQTEGYSFEGHGRFIKCQNPERTGQPSSLSVDTKLNRIFYNSMTGNRPLSAVDWCMKIRDMDFQSTMQLILGENPQGERVERPKYQQHKAQENANTYEPKNLELSERSDTSKHVYAYLTITRCIPENIVKDCLDNNLIYEDVRKNAVFVGYDSENKIPKYAARRGTFTPDGKEPFKRDCTGSDKNFAFRLEGKSCETIYVAEAAIDVLSLAALEDKFNGSGAYKEKTYLSTGGAGIDSALEQFCKTHDVKTINVCFDDDEAGKNGMEKVMQKFRERGYTVNDMRASLAHDYNDELVAFSNDPNFYSKPPDVVASVSPITTEISNESLDNVEDLFHNDYLSPDELAYISGVEQGEQGIPFDDYSIPDEQNYYENIHDYEQVYQERNDIMPEQNISAPIQESHNENNYDYPNTPPNDYVPFDEYSQNNYIPHIQGENDIPPEQYEYSQPVQEKTEEAVRPVKEPSKPTERIALFTIEQNGESYSYKTDKTAKELLNISANSKNPFAEMMKQGERVSNTEYAEILQSDSFKFSVDVNFDRNSASLYAVNDGRGGIADNERTESNTLYKSVNLSSFVVSQPKRDVKETTVPKKPKEEEIAPQPVKQNITPPPKQQQKKNDIRSVSVGKNTIEEVKPEEKVNGLLMSMKDKQENRRAELLDKIGKIDSKIADRQERIEKLENKIADIETSLKTFAAFKRAFGDTPFGKLIDVIAEKQQNKIQRIRDEKIPKHRDKITVQNAKRNKAVTKLQKVNRKIDKIDKVQNFLSALGSKDREVRHKGFVTGLENLSEIRLEKLENKLHKTKAKIDMLSAKYSSPDISHSERYEIGKSIRALKAKTSNITDDIQKVKKLSCDLVDMKNSKFTETEIEKAANRTADKVSECISNPDSSRERGIINTVIAQSVDSGSEAISEIISEKSREQAEKAAPAPERERTSEVSKTNELDILTMAAVITGVNISELNRLPVEVKADIISEFRENNGKVSTEQLAKRICEISDIELPKDFKSQEQPVQQQKGTEKSDKPRETEKLNEKAAEIMSEKETSKNNPLFSRSKIMSDEYKPTSDKSQDDKNQKKDHNIGI